MEEQDRACKTPIEDLRRGALEHYEKLATKCHEYNTSIPAAINAYYSPPAPFEIKMCPKTKVVQRNLTFSEALQALKERKWIRVPEWTGYWFLEAGKINVMQHNGIVTTTPWLEATVLREDWQIVEHDIDEIMEEFKKSGVMYYNSEQVDNAIQNVKLKE